MKMNMDALKALELKLDEYSKTNGTIAEHASLNSNGCTGCQGTCSTGCLGGCKGGCNGPRK